MAADSASRSRYSDEQLQEQVTLGRAIFSTRKDTLKPHAVTDRKDAPIVLRTDPEEDITELLVNLQKRFPRDCRRVTLPILDIFNYFDHQDTHIHGFGVCEHVLRKLGTENEERWTTILPKAKSWALENVQRFDLLEPNEDVTFSKGEVAMYNPAFLDDFSFCIIRLRAQKRSEERKGE